MFSHLLLNKEPLWKSALHQTQLSPTSENDSYGSEPDAKGEDKDEDGGTCLLNSGEDCRYLD